MGTKYMEEPKLAESKLNWFVIIVGIPFFLLCTAIVIYYLIDIVQGGDMVSMIFNSRRGIRHLVIPILFFGSGCIFAWFYRSVKVYPDRVETNYPLHKNWGSTVMMRDVDEYCIENQEDDNKVNHRIFLLTGNKLWYYIGENECRNFKEMHRLLVDYFHLPRHQGVIVLTEEDMATVKHGGYILLED